jgi:branched-chain amino acid transport system substrate-binding protein
MLVDIPHEAGEPRLVLRVTTSADMINRPKAAVLEEFLEPMLRSRNIVRGSEPMRIAIVRADNASGISHADKLLSLIRWNGKNAAENGDFVRQFVVPDELARQGGVESLYELADLVGAYAPHVVIEAGADQAPFLAIERRWPKRSKFRPHYLTSGQFSDPSLQKLIEERADAVRRLFSVNTSTPPTMTKFIMHHNEIFPEKVDLFNSTSAPYDAFYVAAYALIALGDEPVTGKALAKAVRRLVPPGEPIDVGQAGIYTAINHLRKGKSIDLAGTLTSLDFHAETGDATVDFSVRCLDPAKRLTVESGLFYRAKTGKLEGTMKCP